MIKKIYGMVNYFYSLLADPTDIVMSKSHRKKKHIQFSWNDNFFCHFSNFCFLNNFIQTIKNIFKQFTKSVQPFSSDVLINEQHLIFYIDV